MPVERGRKCRSRDVADRPTRSDHRPCADRHELARQSCGEAARADATEQATVEEHQIGDPAQLPHGLDAQAELAVEDGAGRHWVVVEVLAVAGDVDDLVVAVEGVDDLDGRQLRLGVVEVEQVVTRCERRQQVAHLPRLADRARQPRHARHVAGADHQCRVATSPLDDDPSPRTAG